jgi:hypothetical protein
MVERGQMSMSFAEQLRKLKDSLVSDEESYLSEEEVVVVELPKKQIDLVDLCDGDSDEEILVKPSDSDHTKQSVSDEEEEIQVKPSQRSKKAAVKPVNLDTDDEEEDGGSEYWEMESENEDEEDSYDDSDGSWSGADELFDSDDVEEVTRSEEEEDLYNTDDDETAGTRSRSQPRLQKSKNNSANQVDDHPSSPGISLRRSTRLSSTVSPAPPPSSSSR